MTLLTRNDILDGVRELATRLDTGGHQLTLHIVGGAAVMLTVRPDRQSTVDIDTWINTSSEATRLAVAQHVSQIANERGWPDDWLNDKARLFIPEAVGGSTEEWSALLVVGAVTVVTARPDVLLAMKLFAGRGRRDMPDLPALIDACGLTTRAEIESVFETLYPYEEMKRPAVLWLDANY
jgi:hypothetical protein